MDLTEKRLRRLERESAVLSITTTMAILTHTVVTHNLYSILKELVEVISRLG